MFFVPELFGISIIQGRLQDMNGVPVVGLCETPGPAMFRRRRNGLDGDWWLKLDLQNSARTIKLVFFDRNAH